MFKKFLLKRLARYVRQYFTAHPDVKLIVVVGSVGKTSTKIAVARVMSSQYQVRMHDAAPRSRIDTMLQLLGIDYPGNKNSLIAWITILSAVKKRITQPSDTQYIIQELDPYSVGASTWFEGIIHPDIAIVTGVSGGPMRGFQSIEALAKEILEVANFSKFALINRDDNEGRFASFLTNADITTYGTDGNAEHRFVEESSDLLNGFAGKLVSPLLPFEMPVVLHSAGEHTLRPIIAACAVGLLAGLNPQDVITEAEKVRPLPGRMNALMGVRGSILLDDSYSATYYTAISALQTLYSHQAPQRIAVFGDMHDIGPQTPELHEALGSQCDPTELQWVVTVGELTERYLAPQAKAQGCQVRSFRNTLEAGVFIHSVLEQNAIVLFKGSGEGIYLEEAIKIILHSTNDERQLPRQSPAELDAKGVYFVKE